MKHPVKLFYVIHNVISIKNNWSSKAKLSESSTLTSHDQLIEVSRLYDRQDFAFWIFCIIASKNLLKLNFPYFQLSQHLTFEARSPNQVLGSQNIFGKEINQDYDFCKESTKIMIAGLCTVKLR